jgi:hypothetical protein
MLLHRPLIHPTCIAAWARSVLNVKVGRAEQPSTSVARLHSFCTAMREKSGSKVLKSY